MDKNPSLLSSRCYIEHANNVFSADTLRALRNYLANIWDTRMAMTQTEHERRVVDSGVTSDAIRLDPIWFDAWRNADPARLAKFSPFRWVAYPPQVRFVRDHQKHLVPWHQDIGYQKLLGPKAHTRVITCFVPLDDNPSNRSTIQFAHGEYPEMSHKPVGAHGAGIDDVVRARLVHYQLSLGDCLIFGDHAVHRTYVPEEATVERHSLEFRLIDPANALDNKDYFDIDSGLFVRKDGSTRRRP